MPLMERVTKEKKSNRRLSTIQSKELQRKPVAQPKGRSRETWIVNGTLITQDNQRRILPAHLRIVDQTIVEIREGALPKISSNARVISAANQLIAPGLVQTHLHLCQTLFRGMADDLELLDWLSQRIWKFEAAHTRGTLQVSAELGISELLRTGTTCILDMATVRHTDTIFQTVETMGIRANIGKCLMDRTDTNPPSLRESTSAALSEAKTLLAKWHGRDQDRIRASFAPRFALSCSDQLLKQVAEISKEHGILIHTHACENKKEIAWIQKLTGQPNLNYLHSMGVLTPLSVIAHGVWLRESDRRLIARTNAAIAHCPSSNLKLGSGIAELPKLLKAGIKVGIGADGAACSNRLDAFQEMRLATILQKPKFGVAAIDAQKALDLATREGAKALHWFDKVGSIEIGKSADFIMLDAIDPSTIPAPKFPLTDEPLARSSRHKSKGRSIQRDWVSALVYSGHAGLVSQTWVNGKRRYLRGSIGAEGLNSPRLFAKALKAQELIVRRAGFTRSSLTATRKTSRARPTL